MTDMFSGMRDGAPVPSRKRPKPSDNDADPRHAALREFIKQMQQRTGTPQQWNGRCAKALANWLKSCPTVTVEEGQNLIHNRFASDEPWGAPPWEWIPKLAKYSEGPLDKFGKVWRPDFRASIGYR